MITIDNRDAIAAEVRAATARAGFTQKELAERIGISSTALNKKWHGATSFTVEEFIRVAKATSVPVTSLLPETEEQIAAA